MIQTISLSKGEGRVKIDLQALLTGQGIQILVTGGEKPHIGAVVLSVPRPSLSGKGISCDSWITPVLGHKDNIIAQELSEFLCKKINQVVVVSAGVHISNAQPHELELIIENVKSLSHELLSNLKH